jgi:hypothetical protein
LAVDSEHAAVPESAVAPAQLAHVAAPVGLTQCMAAFAAPGSASHTQKKTVAHMQVRINGINIVVGGSQRIFMIYCRGRR